MQRTHRESLETEEPAAPSAHDCTTARYCHNDPIEMATSVHVKEPVEWRLNN